MTLDKLLINPPYFYNLHDEVVNQKYGGDEFNLPYSFHLKCVCKNGHKFRHLLPEGTNIVKIIIACAGHDAIEDARLTYNDIKERFGEDVADIIYCCTEEKGKNRAERHSDKYYNELSQNKLAVYVKLCDFIANVEFGLLTKSSMYYKYKNEYSNFKFYVYQSDFEPMFNHLEKLFEVWEK